MIRDRCRRLLGTVKPPRTFVDATIGHTNLSKLLDCRKTVGLVKHGDVFLKSYSQAEIYINICFHLLDI